MMVRTEQSQVVEGGQFRDRPAGDVVHFEVVLGVARRYHAGAVADVQGGQLRRQWSAAQMDHRSDVNPIGDDARQKGVAQHGADSRDRNGPDPFDDAALIALNKSSDQGCMVDESNHSGGRADLPGNTGLPRRCVRLGTGVLGVSGLGQGEESIDGVRLWVFPRARLSSFLELVGLVRAEAGLETSQRLGCRSGVDTARSVSVGPTAQIAAAMYRRQAGFIILGRATSPDDLPARVTKTLDPGSAGVIDQPLGRVWIDLGGGGDFAGLRLGQFAGLARASQRRLRFHLLCDGEAGSGRTLGGSRYLGQPFLC